MYGIETHHLLSSQIRTHTSQALVGMSVFDFDGGVNGEYVEQLQVGDFEYYKTPLRPSSGNEVSATGSTGCASCSRVCDGNLKMGRQ